MRVGIIWKALEPSPGRYDAAYVAQIANTVRTLARHGVLSLLDFHQDLYNEQFQGEGAPDWAVQDGGLPNLPKAGFPNNYLVNVLFNGGPNTHLGPIGDPRAGFAFHDYCLSEPTTGPSVACTQADDSVFTHAVAHSAQTHDAVMETEFGATNDIPYLDEMVARADRFMVPWLEWAYCGCADPTTSGPGNKQAIVIDPSKSPVGSNLELPTLRALVEPYPQVIAGTPRAWSFARASRTFRLRYSTVRAGGRSRFPSGAVTEIAAPGLVYGGRYFVSVEGGYAVSRHGASTLRIASCRNAGVVTVTLTPGQGAAAACRGPQR